MAARAQALLRSVLRGSPKKRVDLLFATHAILSAAFGTVAVIAPNVAEWLIIHHGERLRVRDNSSDDVAVTHTIVRLLGASLVGQAWFVLQVRRVSDPAMRRACVQAYAVVFALSALCLARAQLTHPRWSSSNWLAILACTLLSAGYGHFAVVAPIVVFEGLGRLA